MHIRLALMYGALFLLFGVQMPYLPVWLDWKGLSASEISVIMAIPMIIRVVFMPLVGFWADASGDGVGVARLLAIGALIFTFGLVTGVADFALVLLVVAMMILAPSLIPLTDTLAMAAVRKGEADYGQVRLWGSLTFIVANLGAGLVIDWAGAGAIAWMMVAGSVVTVAALYFIPRSTLPKPIAGRFQTGVGLPCVKALLRQPSFLLLLLSSGLLQASHAVFYVYGALHWQSLGYSTTLIGMLWAIGVVAEICLFRVGNKALALSGAIGLIAIGGTASIFRWGVMAFEPVLVVLLVLQLTHALTYAATHMGTMHLIARIVPADLAASAQALLAAFTASIAMSGAILMAGVLYVRAGASAYLAMSAIACIGVAVVLWLGTRISREDNY